MFHSINTPRLLREETPTVRLREAIDVNELRDPSGEGVTFEIQEEDEPPEPTDNRYFDAEEVYNNWYADDSEEENQEDDDELSPFEKMAKKMEDICPAKDGGILKKLLKPGSGPVVPIGSSVRVHYNGFLEYADEPYDSSRLRNREERFRVGAGEVIEGWDVAVSTMKKGELSRFLVKPDYAYGHYGCPPRIPADATVMYEIELLNFVEQAGIDDYFTTMTQEEKRDLKFEDIKQLFKAEKKEGNQLYESKKWPMAFKKYKRARQVLEDYGLKNEEEEAEQQSYLLSLYLNMALCCIQLCHSGTCITFCKKALDIVMAKPKNTEKQKHAKALYLYGKALHQLGEFGRSRDQLVKAQSMKPQSSEINRELEKVEEDMKKFKLVERDMYKKMFSKPVGQSADEKEAEDKRIEEAKNKSLKCRDDFAQAVKEQLQSFKSNPDMIEMPLPSANFTVGEIECILQTAEDMDLDYKEKGSGQNYQIKIYKRSPVTS